MTEEQATTPSPGAEVRGKLKNLNVEIVIRHADGSIKEKRIETISKAVQ